MTKEKEDSGAHYRFVYHGIKLDPARICLIYGLTHPVQTGILKKVLCTGTRGHKSMKEDIQDIINACERWLEIIEEDEKLDKF